MSKNIFLGDFKINNTSKPYIIAEIGVNHENSIDKAYRLIELAKEGDLSIKQEIERSLDKGLQWLHGEQNSSSGYWGSPQYPALSALVLRATLGHPNDEEVKEGQALLILEHASLRISSLVAYDNLKYGDKPNAAP